MAIKQVDVAVVGGGHNSLVCAAYLARAGLTVLVLERRAAPGGLADTGPLAPGFRVDTALHDAGLFRADIARELFLNLHGCEILPSEVVTFAPLPDGRQLTLWTDDERSAAAIGALHGPDGARYPAFSAAVRRYAAVLELVFSRVPPALGRAALRRPVPGRREMAAVWPWLDVARRLRSLGGADMYALLRLLPMSLEEMLAEWFDDPAVQGVLAAPGLTALCQGPYSGGTALTWFYHHLAPATGRPATAQVRGGMGGLSQALAASARQFGAEIWTEAPVTEILLSRGRAAGVRLADGAMITARMVASGANPRHTFLELVDPLALETEFTRAVRQIRFRGAAAKLNLALDGLPRFSALPDGDAHRLQGRIQISPSLNYLEEAYDAAKYGRFSPRPYLDIRLPTLRDPGLAPPGQHVMSILAQYAPYSLRDGAWTGHREDLTAAILDTLALYAPDIRDRILAQQLWTPADLADEFGLADGALYHGEMMLDQLLFMRPVPACAGFRSPVEHLYLCGAGAHPGGGVTGRPGQLAAQVILRDWKAVTDGR